MSGEPFPGRHELLAPFGQHTRYLLSGYVRHSLVVILALLTVALSIDLVPQLGDLIGNRSGLTATLRVSWFALMRSVDLMPRFLPLAAFLGVLWTEILHTVSRERILIWNTGRSPLRCLVPVALLGVLFGIVQFAFDGYLRPAAMTYLIEQNVGSRARDFYRDAQNTRWIATGNDLLLTRSQSRPSVALRDLTLYRLTAQGRLYEVLRAATAIPAPEKGSWIVQDGSYWEIPQQNAGEITASSLTNTDSETAAIKFSERTITLGVDPAFVAVSGMYAEHLSLGVLRSLAEGATAEDPRYPFRTRYQMYYANALMPGAMALLASSLSLLLFAYAAPLLRQLITLPFGYAGYLTMKTFSLLGDFDYMAPATAAWFAPVLLLAFSGLLLAFIEWRRRRV